MTSKTELGQASETTQYELDHLEQRAAMAQQKIERVKGLFTLHLDVLHKFLLLPEMIHELDSSLSIMNSRIDEFKRLKTSLTRDDISKLRTLNAQVGKILQSTEQLLQPLEMIDQAMTDLRNQTSSNLEEEVETTERRESI